MREQLLQKLLGAVVAILASAPLLGAGADGNSNWPSVFNDKGGTRFSRLDQINRENVAGLKVAWRYKTGDSHSGSTIECTPLVIDGAMYITTVTTRVASLKADTGEQIWLYDPHVGSPEHNLVISGGVNRGVAYWTD